MKESPDRVEPRWPAALAIVGTLALLAVLPRHIQALPVWVSYAAGVAVLIPMSAVAFAKAGRSHWAGIERILIMALALAYIVNTAAELADMIGIVRIQPPETRAASLLSSSLAIWVSNVVTFSLVYWQVDRGGPQSRAAGSAAKPDWLFPQTATPEISPAGWQPEFADYFFLSFSTATAFSATDVAPLSRRAKLLMTIESTISLLTLVIVAARAVNALP